MLRSLKMPLLIAALTTLGATAQAYIIDDFTEGAATVTLTSGTGSVEAQQTTTNIPGTQRDVWLSITSNPFNQQARFIITGNPSQGASFYNGDVGTFGWVQLDYDGVDVEGSNGSQTAGPGMNLNLFGETGLVFNFLSADAPVRVDVMATTFGASEHTSVGNFTTSGNITSSTQYTLDFDDLTLGVGSTEEFDISDVDRLVFRFTPQNASGDFALGSITTVPEPGSIAILAAGVAGLLRLRRRQR